MVKVDREPLLNMVLSILKDKSVSNKNPSKNIKAKERFLAEYHFYNLAWQLSRSWCFQPASTWSKLTIKTLEKRPKYVNNKDIRATIGVDYWCCCGVSVVNFEHISHLVLVFLVSNLNMWFPAEIGGK